MKADVPSYNIPKDNQKRSSGYGDMAVWSSPTMILHEKKYAYFELIEYENLQYLH